MRNIFVLDTSAADEIEDLVDDAENTVRWLTTPAYGKISAGGWTGIGAIIGLVIGILIAVLLIMLGMKGKGPLKSLKKEEKQVIPDMVTKLTVQKLHEQGARNSQQDSFFVSAEAAKDNLLAVVADGMGGLADGDKVSQTAAATMAQEFYNVQDADPQRLLLELLKRANAAVNNLLGYNGLYQSGSTMVAGLVRQQCFYYISVGDSRISLYRDGELTQLNREHIYRNDLYISGVNGENTLQSAGEHPKAAGLSSFLGMGELKYIDIPAQPVDLRPGDRIILMSDGVYNALPEEEMCAALGEAPELAVDLLNTAIKSKAYRNQDNYTAVIIDCS